LVLVDYYSFGVQGQSCRLTVSSFCCYCVTLITMNFLFHLCFQDAAYLESLLLDQEKERKRKAEEEEKQKELEESLREAEEARQEAEMIERLKDVLMTKLPGEPEAGDPEAVRILLKCPSGLRLERRFLKSDQIKASFCFD
jgi:transcription initiation factor IIF auxiliary subunit